MTCLKFAVLILAALLVTKTPIDYFAVQRDVLSLLSCHAVPRP